VRTVNERLRISQSALARALGVDNHTVHDLSRAWHLAPKTMSNGAARGLNEADVRVLLRALNRDESVIEDLLRN
jgi:hypothetical protein